MRDLVLILMLALVATCVVIPRESGGITVESSQVPLPQLDSVGAGAGPGLSPTGANPLMGWLIGQLWSAIYALEGIS